jgi:hypothetical protein
MSIVISAWSVEIDATPVDVRAGSLHIAKTANGRATASFQVISQNRSYRPVLDDEVIIEANGARVFGGYIDQPTEQGFAVTGIVTTISCVDFNGYAERRLIRESIPAGTMKSQLVILVAYLSAYGVTLDAGQVNGPNLEAMELEDVPLPDVLDEIARLTTNSGEPYVWNIDAFKVLSMVQPSTQTAPVNVTEGASSIAIGDVEVEPTNQHRYTRVIVRMLEKSAPNRTETFTATAAQTTFDLYYSVATPRTVVVVNGVDESLSEIPGAADWLLTRTPTTQLPDTLTRNLGGLTAGDTVAFTFDGFLFARFVATDPAHATEPRDMLVTVDDIPSIAAGQAMADAHLAETIATPVTVRYQTLELGLEPGQEQTFTLPARNVSTTGVINDVVITDYGAYNLLSTVTATTGEIRRPNWRNVYKIWADKGGGGSGAASAGTGPVAGGVPGLPDRSVQFNDSGAFGGDAEFLYYRNENSLLCGGGGSSIQAPQHESCQNFGFNCHIL